MPAIKDEKGFIALMCANNHGTEPTMVQAQNTDQVFLHTSNSNFAAMLPLKFFYCKECGYTEFYLDIKKHTKGVTQPEGGPSVS